MAPVKKEPAEMSAFERKRLENMSANQEILKDMSATASKIMPLPAGRPKKSSAPKKKTVVVKRESLRPTRTSSRLAGVEADSETAKRKAEVEEGFAREQAKAKKMRVRYVGSCLTVGCFVFPIGSCKAALTLRTCSGDLSFGDMVVEGKKYKSDEGFLGGVMRGARPNVRTFGEEDVRETTDEGLKALREKMGALELYEGFEPNRKCTV